jgi:subtilisin family serine protease
VIVDVIDTGIQPGHPSFADDPADGFTGPAYGPAPDTWGGTCQTGPGFTAGDCNNKLIGARFYVSGFGTANLATGSHLSPRDDEGHGSHTASTAAGNFGVDPEIDGNDLGVNRISGIAPRARVAALQGVLDRQGRGRL